MDINNKKYTEENIDLPKMDQKEEHVDAEIQEPLHQPTPDKGHKQEHIETVKERVLKTCATMVISKLFWQVVDIVILGVGCIYLKAIGFDFGSFSFSRELKIDNTANVVEKVRAISEFTTACYYEEAVLKKDTLEAAALNSFTSMMNISVDSVRREVVLLAKGKVRAGFDFSKITSEQLRIKADTVSIELPLPEVFDIIVNPSDYEIFVEEGKWSHQDISSLQSSYKDALHKKALENGILDKASKEGKLRTESLFKSFGFSVVNVTVLNQ